MVTLRKVLALANQRMEQGEAPGLMALPPRSRAQFQEYGTFHKVGIALSEFAQSWPDQY